jgi:hypothetical protein
LEPSPFQPFLDISCFDLVFERPNVLVGKIKNTNIYFCFSNVDCVKTTWYYNNVSEPSASDEISFEEVMTLLGDSISDELIFNLDIFRNKRRSKDVTK